MISTRKELKEFLRYEKTLYFKSSKEYLEGAVLRNVNYLIYRFLVHLRKAEYHISHSEYLSHKFFMIMHLYIKNRLGLALGFQIPAGCFDKGLKIYHLGSVIVNSQARIGVNCQIAGDTCIGSKGPGPAPHIGKNIFIGWGAAIIGDIRIADDVCVGAGSVVVDSILTSGVKIAGIPAKELQQGEKV